MLLALLMAMLAVLGVALASQLLVGQVTIFLLATASFPSFLFLQEIRHYTKSNSSLPAVAAQLFSTLLGASCFSEVMGTKLAISKSIPM